MNMPTPQLASQLAAATSQQAALVRLAWIFGSRDDLMLLRLPMLTEIVRLRHSVLVVAPELDRQDVAEISDLGIEFAVLPRPRMRYNPLSSSLWRHRLASRLHDWNCRAAIVEDADHLEASIRAASQAGVQAIYPVLPALERGPAPAGSHRSWRKSLERSAAIFVPSDNERRLLDQSLRKSTTRIAVLPPFGLNLNDIVQRPLPPIAEGVKLLGAIDSSRGTEGSAFVEASKALQGQCLFESIDLSARPSNRGTIDATTSHLRLIATAVEASHVVIVDDIGAGHFLLLAIALAVGRPVLVADIAYYRDLVDSGANGSLFSNGSGPALTASIRNLLKRSDLLVGMARASRQKAERKLNQNTVWREAVAVVGLGTLSRKAA